MKRYRFILLIMLLLTVTSACSPRSTETQTVETSAAVVSSTAAANTPEPAVEAEALTGENLAAETRETHENLDDYVWEDIQAINITLNENSISTSGAGVSIDGSLATITTAGTFKLNGTLNDGQVIVDTEDEGTVKIILDNANITNTTSAALYIKNAEKVVLILAEGSQNTLSDGVSYAIADEDEDEPNAALFSDADLTIYGYGALSVIGNHNDGIASKDGLIIAGGEITISTVDDGIRGKDYLVIKEGAITVNCTGDGLIADNDADSALGFIILHNGSLEVTSGGDAISAQTDVLVNGGDYTLASGGGSGAFLDGETSTKGIKGITGVVINSGTFTINSADDAIHSNGDITINGGNLQLASGDDGMHADTSLTINDGRIEISESYEGLESAVITLNDGTIRISSSDDGINVASGVDGSGMGINPGVFAGGNLPQGGQPGGLPGGEPAGQPGSKPFGGPMQDAFTETGDYYLYVNGGNIYVEADGDGIDVNGSIEMSAGLVIVNGPTENINAALDYLGSFNISGGTLVAAGSAGMAQAPGDGSSQNSLLINLDAIQSAGVPIHIQDDSGTSLVTFTPAKSYQSFVFSSTDLVTGGDYTIFSGGSISGETAEGLSTSGSYDPGEELVSFTVTSTLTSLGNTGGMGGGRRK